MSYYTTFTLKVEPRKEGMDEMLLKIARAFNEMMEYEYFDDWEMNYIKNNNTINFTFETKWYSVERKMEEFSTKFPEYSFFVEGRGENVKDWWVQYFKNGMRSKICEVISPQEVAEQEIEESFKVND